MDVERPEGGTGPRDPEELVAAGPAGAAPIGAGTRMGAVELSVADLDRSIAYYTSAIGLRPLERSGEVVSLGAGDEELLVLVAEPGARPADGYAGLYHFALLVPDRPALAGFLAHAARERVPLVGLSDHFVSEAIYLSDPDHHGIEVYADRPRERWQGQVATRMGTWPLDVDGLLGELEDPAGARFDGVAAGTTMGHVHLRVTDVPETIAFYGDALGFELMAQLGRQAAFLGAGGYHHHLGANTWETVHRSQPPPGTATLRRTSIVLEHPAELDRVAGRLDDAGHEPVAVDGGVVVRDPSGNELLLSPAT